MNDAVLVRAPIDIVYRTLTNLDGWPDWLPGCRSARLPAVRPPRDHHVLLLTAGHVRWRLGLEVYDWRHNHAVRWDVRGAVVLTAEWWLEQVPEGTILHHVVHGQPRGRRAQRRVRRHRRAMVQSMQVMKDHLELAVAVAAGRLP